MRFQQAFHKARGAKREHLNAAAFMVQSDAGSPLVYAVKEIIILIYYLFRKVGVINVI